MISSRQRSKTVKKAPPKFTAYQDTGMGSGAYPILDNTMEQLRAKRRNSSKPTLRSGSEAGSNAYPQLDATMDLNYRDSEGPIHAEVDEIGEPPLAKSPAPRGDQIQSTSRNQVHDLM